MNKAKIFSCLLILLSLSNVAYSQDLYHYALTDMTWSEFYEGEVGEGFDANQYDAVSSATQRFNERLNQLVSNKTESGGSIYSGIKAVQVRMNQDVYNLLSNDSRYFSWDVSEFDEYKDVDSDGKFSAMTTKTQKAENISVTLDSGASIHHSQYALKFKGLDLDSLGLKLGEGSGKDSNFEYYLGGIIETSDGKKYGLKHLDNLWLNRGEIGFCVSPFYDKGDKGYAHTADLQGKTITKIIYMLKNQPDLCIDGLNIYVKQQSNATVKPVSEVFIRPDDIRLVINNAPSDAKYDMVVSLTYDDPNGHHGRSKAPEDAYTFNDGVLVITDSKLANATHSYNIVLGDSSGKYVDIGTGQKAFKVQGGESHE